MIHRRRFGEEHVERGRAERPGLVGVGGQVVEASHHRRAIGERAVLAVVVQRQPDVAELGDVCRPCPLDVVEAGSLVADQHAGNGPAPSGTASVPRKASPFA